MPRRARSACGMAEISQFILALYILLLVAFLPLLNLADMFVAAAVEYLQTNDLVSKASAQQNYPNALTAMTAEAYFFQSTGLARFLKMVPQGGFTGCGSDLYVTSTDIKSGTVAQSPADEPLTDPIDTARRMYELTVVSHFSVAPLINLSSMPVIGDIPGLGKPVSLSFKANRPVEHPAGLQTSKSAGVSETAANVSHFPRVSSGNFPPNSSWRDPNLYPQIQAAGKTVISSTVLLVQANNPNWTASNITVNAGEKIWIDTQAVGQWACDTPPDYLDANGYTYLPGNYLCPNSTVPTCFNGALVGRVGPSGTPFFLGNQQFNYPPPGTSGGTFSLIYNDIVNCYSDNHGAQEVRIVVTN